MLYASAFPFRSALIFSSLLIAWAVSLNGYQWTLLTSGFWWCLAIVRRREGLPYLPRRINLDYLLSWFPFCGFILAWLLPAANVTPCDVLWMVNNQLWVRDALVCSVFPFLWCKYSYYGQFQATNLISVNVELGREVRYTVCFPRLGWASSSTPLLESILPGNCTYSSLTLQARRRAAPHCFQCLGTALSPVVFLTIPIPLKIIPLLDSPQIIQFEVPSVFWWGSNWFTKLHCVEISHLEIFSLAVLQIL